MKLSCVHSGSPRAKQSYEDLCARYDFVTPEDSDVIVALGGDGMLLHSLHDYLELDRPIFGMNRGTVGFLMNHFSAADLEPRIEAAGEERLRPLRMSAKSRDGSVHDLVAFNEVSLIRLSRQAANIRLSVDGVERIPKMMCDGVLVCTPAGSTAYNFSASGPIIPLGSNVISLVPLSPFRPRRWSGALLRNTSVITFENLDADKRPLGASADFIEIENVVSVTIQEDPDRFCRVLFDEDQSLEERIVAEQFNH